MQADLKINPPQPIPYPHNKVIKEIYRYPLQLYRLGLNRIIGKYILILSTFGRKTGNVHRTPVEYFRHQGRIFVMSGFGTESDWFKNINNKPHVTFQTDRGTLCAIARKPETEEEWEGVFEFLRSSPVARLSEPALLGKIDEPQIRTAIKTWPILTFDPTDEVCPPPLETDLLWTWPLILFGIALFVLINWLWQRKIKICGD